ncbi:hypothetical protein GOV11_03230 [Candidatus Woesearchaeota archaeon]|nr:hypothetical protein [Candidatus Woesearchaeota archaeon]
MTRYHLKRKTAPNTWPIPKKTTKFIMRPRPSGHTMEFTLPVTVVLREILGLVQTARQVRAVLKENEVMVNGVRIHQGDAPVGFMDILTVGKVSYRVALNEKNLLTVTPVKKGEDITLQRIKGKTSLKGGKIQLNCFGGMNLIVPKNNYKVGDTIALDMKRKITAHYALGQGTPVLVIGGNHTGKIGMVKEFDDSTSSVNITVGKDTIRTAKQYAFALGKDKPVITL